MLSGGENEQLSGSALEAEKRWGIDSGHYHCSPEPCSLPHLTVGFCSKGLFFFGTKENSAGVSVCEFRGLVPSVGLMTEVINYPLLTDE